MITDPVFFAVAVPAVILTGLAKGGLGGALALFAVPLMALVISPIAAAAIMLPILIAMDIVALVIYRRRFDGSLLRQMLPGATVGVFVGYLTASVVTEPMVRLLVGLLALAFALNFWLRPAAQEARAPNAFRGGFWGMMTGFTSFVSHAGGPPYQVYTLPLRLEKTIFIGTSVVAFSYINAIKLVPYALLGQFSATNLATSAVLLPLAPVSIWAGSRLVLLFPQETFYRWMYALMLVLSVKLIWDGLGPLLAGAVELA